MDDDKRTIPIDVIEDDFSFNLTFKRKKNEKKFKLTRLYRFMPLLALFIIISCEKDNDVSSYYGSWLTKKTIPMMGSSPYLDVVYYLVISENEFVESFVDYPNEISHRCIIIKGSFSATENLMEFTPKQISFTSGDYNTEPYATYSSEEENFGIRLSGLRNIVSGNNAEFSFTGDSLILKIKHPDWEEYPEYFETVTYTRP